MTSEFIGKDIDVTVEGEIRAPVSFRLNGKEYIIEKVVDFWPDYGFGKNASSRRRWWQRHHRNYYRVRTTGGEVYEIYYDRGVNLNYPERRKWFLTRKISG